MRVLVIGPSPSRSKGGMATVIKEIIEDPKIKEKCIVDMHESYIDGNVVHRCVFSLIALIKFYFCRKNYDLYHIHAASYKSTYRKQMYLKIIKHWNKKVIFHVHGGKYIEFFNGLSDNKKEKLKRDLMLCDMVIALSEDWKQKLQVNLNVKNCRVLENGVDVDAFIPSICDVDEYHNSFLFLGRICEGKGIYDLISAVKNVSNINNDIHLYIAGDGEIDKVKKIIKNNNLDENITVVGWIDKNEKMLLLKKVCTLVLPSYNEGLPMAILESMSCGKAIISSKVGAIPEVVKEKNGSLIVPGDVSELSNLLILYSTNKKLLKNFKLENIDLVKNNYSMNKMHRTLLEYYHEIMEKK